MQIIFDKIDEYLDSEEGKLAMQKFTAKLQSKRRTLDQQLWRAHKKYDDRFEELIQKILNKYSSDEYLARYQMYQEPQESLLWFGLEYAKRFGRDCTEDEYDTIGNDFTSELFTYKGYWFERMDGQGSIIRVFKI